MKTFNTIALLAAFVVTPGAAFADQPRADAEPIVVAAAHQAMTDGEVRKVDPAAKKITIKHGELKNLDMPAMTMVFQVKDPTMLDKVKAGDKVRFRADKINGAFTVVEIEAVK
jgi:Cu/Ag efflux protein CusF